MKKLLGILLFIVSLTLLVGLATYHSSSRSQRLSDLSISCSEKPSTSFSSVRAHGVILKNRAVLTVRLEGEKNFSPPGGHLKVNESPEQALQRELGEELSIQTGVKDYKTYTTYCEVLGATQTQRTHVFFVEDWSENLQVGNKDQLKWVQYEYRLDPDADTELVKLLDFLHKDNLID